MLFTLLALTIAAPALKDKASPAAPLVGEWIIEQATVGGQGPEMKPDGNRWIFRADGTREIKDPTGKSLVGGNYKVDPTTGELDLDGDMPPALPYFCLQKVQGDVLTLNVGWQKAPRPSAFESLPGSKCTLYVMKRVKQK